MKIYTQISKQMKNRHNKQLRYMLATFVISILLVQVFDINLLHAATADITRSFLTSDTTSAGDIVALTSGDTDRVEKANRENDKTPLGVVVADTDSLIEIDKSENTVQIAVAGRAKARVSTVNGDISRGDLIGLSEEKGLGSKALPGVRVVGIAQEDFNDDLRASRGTDLISVVIAVGVAPVNSGSANGAVQWLTNIAGHNITLLQALVSLMIAIIGVASVVVLVYSSIRNSIAAVGRNPLAKPAIFQALAQVMTMVSIIGLSCVTLMFLILRF